MLLFHIIYCLALQETMQSCPDVCATLQHFFFNHAISSMCLYNVITNVDVTNAERLPVYFSSLIAESTIGYSAEYLLLLNLKTKTLT